MVRIILRKLCQRRTTLRSLLGLFSWEHYYESRKKQYLNLSLKEILKNTKEKSGKRIFQFFALNTFL